MEIEDDVGLDRDLLDREGELEARLHAPRVDGVAHGRERGLEGFAEAVPDLGERRVAVDGGKGVHVHVARGAAARGPRQVDVAAVEVEAARVVENARHVVADLLVRRDRIHAGDEDEAAARGLSLEEVEEREDRRVSLQLGAMDVRLDVRERPRVAAVAPEDRGGHRLPGGIRPEDELLLLPLHGGRVFLPSV